MAEVDERVSRDRTEQWRESYLNAAQWIAWFLEKYDLAEDVQPDEVDALIRERAIADSRPGAGLPIDDFDPRKPERL